MFARIVEMSIRPDKINDFRTFATKDILPVLKKQNGFVDAMALIGDDSTHILSLTFWKTKADIERYERDDYANLIEKTKLLLNSEPKVRVYNVHTSTFHRITEGMAA
ncbi:MAG TPA: antibiotic biosynthesis monooxygenase [Clostridia bacterium]|nr:antibiotic biosynthesis monooxygenase [Clostridia bacterium]